MRDEQNSELFWRKRTEERLQATEYEPVTLSKAQLKIFQRLESQEAKAAGIKVSGIYSADINPWLL